jgi:hypothetical protein
MFHVESYTTKNQRLTEYFLITCALQNGDENLSPVELAEDEM